MNLTAAQYGLTKMQIATEEANHDSVTAEVAIKHFQRNFQMPADLSITQYERTVMMPSTVAMNNVQVDRILPARLLSLNSRTVFFSLYKRHFKRFSVIVSFQFRLILKSSVVTTCCQLNLASNSTF